MISPHLNQSYSCLRAGCWEPWTSINDVVYILVNIKLDCRAYSVSNKNCRSEVCQHLNVPCLPIRQKLSGLLAVLCVTTKELRVCKQCFGDSDIDLQTLQTLDILKYNDRIKTFYRSKLIIICLPHAWTKPYFPQAFCTHLPIEPVLEVEPVAPVEEAQ